ncbi:non-ribosomal peptide synthetase [Brevibacillus dissolubilis]|uniref:non-ribosomal peptide synthetase n=1 Tax=Brevibacillus dissolubilis TaxID=1844116 RepID=UPI001116ADC1|nr:non-ribosomal peptide synthetase [Brevibacillus dissolubilis]
MSYFQNDQMECDTAVQSQQETYIFPASFAQQSLWYRYKMEADSARYNIMKAMKMTGSLDVSALHRSIHEVIRRHETLRTTFSEQNDVPIQVISSAFHLEIPIIPFTDFDHEEEREKKAHEWMEQQAQIPFNLETGPLIRFHLLKLGGQEHILCLTMHHIISDGWSIGILIKEISAIYQAIYRNEPSPLQELAIQYADFSEWQRELLEGDAIQSQIDYWKQKLSGELPVLQLPTDFTRPPVPSGAGVAVTFLIPKSIQNHLSSLCQQEGVTLSMLMLAIFKVILYRYSGQTDLIVGTPVANRNDHEIEELIGYFINTLAIRTDLSNNLTFRDLLQQIKQTTLEAYSNQSVPFEKIVDEINPIRNPSYMPVFQVMFILQNAPLHPFELPNLSVTSIHVDNGTSKFDLTLSFTETSEGLEGQLVYRTDLFERDTIEEMLEQYQQVIQSVCNGGQAQRIADIPLRSAGYQDVVQTDAPSKWEAHSTIHSVFEEQALRVPDHIAIKTKDSTLSYHELNQAANHVAGYLLEQVPAQEQRIFLLFDNSSAMIIGTLGALKAGKTYVPLDPTYPIERLSYIVQECGASTIVTSRPFLALAQQLQGDERIITIDDMDFSISTANVHVSVQPDAEAYILFTSGSTGKPKGIMQSHKNVMKHMETYSANLGIQHEDRVTLIPSYSVDAGIMDIYAALLNGATLFPFDTKEEIDRIEDFLYENKITIYHSTPTVYRYLLNKLSDKSLLSTIRYVVLGGEEVFERDAVLYKEYFSDQCILVNGYGPSECTVAMQFMCNKSTKVRKGTFPVGKPVKDIEILLLDENNQRAGVSGEIAIRGSHNALGYWNQPELTKQVFIPCPEDPSKTIYKTGDMGRRTPDDHYVFMGRKDSQVKIRGFRIELGEIEEAIVTHPEIRETVVLAKGERGEQHLVAYLVSSEGRKLASSELRDFLRDKLPIFMIPSYFVFMDSIPLTPTGKINRLALPDQQHDESVELVMPRDEVEEKMAEIWASLFGCERVSIRHNFFDLGGHSLIATQLVSRIRNEFHIQMHVHSLFKYPTIEELCSQLKKIKESQEEEHSFADLLDQIEQLSAEEIRKRLDEEGVL